MLKKFAVSLLTLAFLTFGAGTCLAAPTATQIDELKALNQQMFTLKKEIVDKQLEAGLIDKEKAADIKTHIDKHQKKMEENFANGQYTGFGKKHAPHKNPSPCKP
ncbi:DUF2680 domain-containing protein [Desulfitobacterium sp.]|uniref:DUF2680 domain-containing protein n=1 Tax=Desulfitobacterium sp. TaxID=49981 RepID=UPI002B1FE5E3|nr:DUF2680 domain-containing protein [Desulfitobacterium sp.]MEA4902698.1 DUF2680 domain-containing protein [Desulfitobacterium sp.]